MFALIAATEPLGALSPTSSAPSPKSAATQLRLRAPASASAGVRRSSASDCSTAVSAPSTSMANHHIVRSMLSAAMDRSSGAPSSNRQANSAPILAGESFLGSGAAGRLRNPPVFSAEGSRASSSRAAAAGVEDDESYNMAHFSAGNGVNMEGMITAADVQHDDAISSQPQIPYVGMTFDTS